MDRRTRDGLHAGLSAPFEVLCKAGTKRAWKLFEELKLEALQARDSQVLLEELMLEQRICTDDPIIYKQRVLAISGGIPGELERLVKCHAVELMVKAREVAQLGQGVVDREEFEAALAPIILALGAFTVAWRYIARMAFRRALRPKSR